MARSSRDERRIDELQTEILEMRPMASVPGPWMSQPFAGYSLVKVGQEPKSGRESNLRYHIL